MTTWFVTRHPGALAWASRHGITAEHFVEHLSLAEITSQIGPGDTVRGILPVNLAAAVCQQGARYQHLTVELPAQMRGKEIDVNQLDALQARLQIYHVEPLP
ncbi:MAG: CRISPR-associated protein Csx16 [Rhodoferax sp.]|nr:CRISPR-associated protein Csx16 [Rhodoferax sp.]